MSGTKKHGWYDNGVYSDLYIDDVELVSVSLKDGGVIEDSKAGDFHYVQYSDWIVIAHFDDIDKGKKIMLEVFS
jgi:hypothetical protein